MPHDTLSVARVDDAYIASCDCGWSTDPAATGSEIGDAWDRHRRGAKSDGAAGRVQAH